ncbi:hypothetical protein DFJ74DRAFT_767943 [Hyaloraphidium curvatum]|nr:hypothetical protein DFJ74DRAFT_767943 [Hyaloraphidium curvatum]
MSLPPPPAGRGMERRRTVGGDELGFAPTADEAALFGALFRRADDGSGAAPPAAVLNLLPRSGLPKDTLRAIWAVADADNRGFLTMAGFFRALKLVAVAQAGQPVSPGLLGMKTPLPVFEDVAGDAPPAPPQNLARSGTGFGGDASNPAFNVAPEERQRWMNAFQQAGPQNGLVGAVAARDFFLRSGLPPETLSRIWTLADAQGRGALGVNEFLVAMFLISRVKAGAFPGVPGSLPPQVLAAITGQPAQQPFADGPAPVSSAPLASPSKAPTSTSPLPDSFASTVAPARLPSSDGAPAPWLIGPKEKDAYDRVFEKADMAGKGYLTTEEASSFFRQSNLPSNTLANIWTLSNISKSGRYSKDEFAVAMHLIRQARADVPLPTVLPPNLVPPSMRRPSVTAPAPAPAAPPPVTQSFSQDLFSFDAPAAAPAPPPMTAASSGIFSAAASIPPTPAPTRTMTVPASTPSAQQSFFDSVPASVGGRSPMLGTETPSPLVPAGIPPAAAAAAKAAQQAEDTLRSDIANKKQEISMAQVQAATINISAEQTKQRRADLEAELAQLNAERAELATKVNQIKTLYEADKQVVQQLESQALPLRTEVSSLQQGLSQTSQQRDGLRTQIDAMNAEIVGLQAQATALRADNDALNAELEAANEGFVSLGVQIDTLKAELEHRRSELERVQGERSARAAEVEARKAELAALQQERERIRQETERAAREAELAAQEAAEIAARTAALAASEIESTAAPVSGPTEGTFAAAEAAPAADGDAAKPQLTVDVNVDPFAEPSGPSPPIPDSSTKPTRSTTSGATPEPRSTEEKPAETVTPVSLATAPAADPFAAEPPHEPEQAAEAAATEPAPEVAQPAEETAPEERPARTPSPFDVDGFQGRFPDIEVPEEVEAEAAPPEAAVTPLANPDQGEQVVEAVSPFAAEPAAPETRPSAAAEQPAAVAWPAEVAPAAAPDAEPVNPFEVEEEIPPEPAPFPEVPAPVSESPVAAPVPEPPLAVPEQPAPSVPDAPAPTSSPIKTPFDIPDLDAEFEDAFKDIPAAPAAAAAGPSAVFDDSVFDAAFEDDSFKFETQAKFAAPPTKPAESQSADVSPVSGINPAFVNFDAAFDAPFEGGFAGGAAAPEEDPFVAITKGTTADPFPDSKADLDSAFGPSTVPTAGHGDDNPFASDSGLAPQAAAAAFDAAFEADFDSAFANAAPAAGVPPTVTIPPPGSAPVAAAGLTASPRTSSLPKANGSAVAAPRPPTAADDEAPEVKQVKEIAGCTTEQAVDALAKNDWDVQRAVNSIFG